MNKVLLFSMLFISYTTFAKPFKPTEGQEIKYTKDQLMEDVKKSVEDWIKNADEYDKLSKKQKEKTEQPGLPMAYLDNGEYFILAQAKGESMDQMTAMKISKTDCNNKVVNQFIDKRFAEYPPKKKVTQYSLNMVTDRNSKYSLEPKMTKSIETKNYIYRRPCIVNIKDINTNDKEGTLAVLSW